MPLVTPLPGAVHVWLTHLDWPGATIAACSELLSPAEIQRAERFRFERDRRRYKVAHACLRRLLADYSGVPPKEIALGEGTHGKPVWEHSKAVHFNLSHAHELAAYAVASCPLGIDIEYIRPVPDALDIAARTFSPQESAALRALPDQDRLQAFFLYWTRKEAYLKATGLGFSGKPESFAVSLDIANPRFLSFAGEPGREERWSLKHLDPAPGYTGAVALEGLLHSVEQRWMPVT